MPIPVAIWIIGVFATIIIGGSIAVLCWDDVVTNLSGKKLAILGARGTGKTTLHAFLSTGSLPKEYVQTTTPEKTGSRRFQLKELDLKIKKSRDLSGSKEAYREWMDLCADADLVLYLFRADRVGHGEDDAKERLLKDVRHIHEKLQARNPRPRLYLVGTHCDLIPEYKSITPQTAGDFLDDISGKPFIRELKRIAGGQSRSTLVCGSLLTTAHTETLVYSIFAQELQ